jgi:FPC/CPF motif-containing protein YcgG/uncharacterized protein YbdZ (MbtH family)
MSAARDHVLVAPLALGAVPSWGPAAARGLLDTLLDAERPFPCTFAVAAARKGTLRFGFCDSPADPAGWGPLGEILDRYLDVYRELGKDTSLVVLFRPEERVRSLDDYFHRFWAVLQHLHDGDPRPWPESTPLEPEELWWEFSYGGTEIFVVCNTPAHTTRHSRHSPCFMITFQPRWVFEGLEAHTPRGAGARRVIRNRIRRFDGMEPAAELGNHGEDGNREWRQYFLPDTADGAVLACPFLARADARQPRAAATAPSPAPAPAATYELLVNDDRQFSLWPAGLPLPGPAWRPTGVRDDRDACLAHVARVWTDMRPARAAGRRPAAVG